MSRSGYTDDCGGWDLIRWRRAVTSAIRGRNGQRFLREMLTALDSIPDKSLISEELEKDGDVCALGAVGKARGLDMTTVNPEDRESVAAFFGIPNALAAEIMYENDEDYRAETPEQRWIRMRKWIAEHLAVTPAEEQER